MGTWNTPSTRPHHHNHPYNHSRSNPNKDNRNNRNNSITNNSITTKSMTRFGHGPGLRGVKYACMLCKKDNHTDTDCSNKDRATSHIAHQVQVQAAEVLAPYLPTHAK
jgi:hypothetical protein